MLTLPNENIETVVPDKSNCRPKIEHGRTLYKERSRIERILGQLKINETIFTRHELMSNTLLEMVHLTTAGYHRKSVDSDWRSKRYIQKDNIFIKI